MAMIFRLFAGSHIHLFTLVHNISPRFYIVFMQVRQYFRFFTNLFLALANTLASFLPLIIIRTLRLS